MRNATRIVAALALAALLGGCAQGQHPYTASGPSITDQTNQAYWKDFSAAKVQKMQWNEQVDRERRVRLDAALSPFRK
jgi:ABC-type uncharacterized transport system auxiliary subunit